MLRPREPLAGAAVRCKSRHRDGGDNEASTAAEEDRLAIIREVGRSGGSGCHESIVIRFVEYRLVYRA